MSTDVLLYEDGRVLGSGDVYRYCFTVDANELPIGTQELCLRIKNAENPLLWPFYITGPYSLYIDVRPFKYDEDKPWDETVQFCSDLRPDEHFYAKLLINENSLKEGSKHMWTVDILSQVCVTAAPTVEYKLRLGTTRKSTKQHEPEILGSKINVETWDTLQLWNLPPKEPEKPVHLVILTHGIFANIGCDMLYMKEKIEKIAATSNSEDDTKNVIVRGYMGNRGKSAHGIRYLGVRVGKYVLKLCDELSEDYKVDKISFVGHSLGGPTQTMAIHYIALERPDFFEKIEPVNFITLSSPFLGVVNDVPLCVTFGLEIGTFGLTGRDLALRYTPLTSREGLASICSDGKGKRPLCRRPVMEILPLAPAQQVLQKFRRRTLYASVLHDGIVPLRTAALLYLDWRSLGRIEEMRKQQRKKNRNTNSRMGSPQSVSPVTMPSMASPAPVGVIPETPLEKKATAQFFMPYKLIKYKKYARYQIADSSKKVESEPAEPRGISREEAKFYPPHEASTILAALSVLLSPLPTQEYIKDPSSRTDSIIHDRMYHPTQLPPPHYKSRPFYKKIIYPNESINKLQEEIARSWQNSMSWRKVLLDLKPDAHNNIVVRRRFVNIFGNVAIRHLAENHFTGNQTIEDSH